VVITDIQRHSSTRPPPAVLSPSVAAARRRRVSPRGFSPSISGAASSSSPPSIHPFPGRGAARLVRRSRTPSGSSLTVTDAPVKHRCWQVYLPNIADSEVLNEVSPLAPMRPSLMSPRETRRQRGPGPRKSGRRRLRQRRGRGDGERPSCERRPRVRAGSGDALPAMPLS
jgi:hypothetical protein